MVRRIENNHNTEIKHDNIFDLIFSKDNDK